MLLPAKGTVEQTKEGFVFLKVCDDYIFRLFSLLQEQGIELPPYFGKGRVGAHITIVSVQEMQEVGFPPIKDLGKEISFKIVNIASVKPDSGNTISKVYLLTIEAPELETLRASLGLSPRVANHDFHITIGVEHFS